MSFNMLRHVIEENGKSGEQSTDYLNYYHFAPETQSTAQQISD